MAERRGLTPIEDAKADNFRNGWSDEVYIATFNQKTIGTIINGIPDDFLRNQPNPPYPMSETQKIRILNDQDKEQTLAIFFQSISRLPTIVDRHLSGFTPLIRFDAFNKAASFFVETSRRLQNDTKPVKLDSDTEDFLKQISDSLN